MRANGTSLSRIETNPERIRDAFVIADSITDVARQDLTRIRIRAAQLRKRIDDPRLLAWIDEIIEAVDCINHSFKRHLQPLAEEGVLKFVQIDQDTEVLHTHPIVDRIERSSSRNNGVTTHESFSQLTQG